MSRTEKNISTATRGGDNARDKNAFQKSYNDN